MLSWFVIFGAPLAFIAVSVYVLVIDYTGEERRQILFIGIWNAALFLTVATAVAALGVYAGVLVASLAPVMVTAQARNVLLVRGPVAFRSWLAQPTRDGIWNFREFWKLFGFLFGQEMNEQIYEPRAEELTVSYNKARRLAKYRLAVWWLNFCFTVRTAGLIFACIRYSLTDKVLNALLGLLPPNVREFVKAVLGLPPSID